MFSVPTGMNFYTRQQASLTEAISDASSIVMVSILGLVITQHSEIKILRYQNALIYYLLLLSYVTAPQGGQRVYGYEGVMF